LTIQSEWQSTGLRANRRLAPTATTRSISLMATPSFSLTQSQNICSASEFF